MVAQSLGYTGWIRNLSNGNVDMEIQGSYLDINDFIRRVKQDSRWIRIDDYSVMEIDVRENERRFEVAGYY